MAKRNGKYSEVERLFSEEMNDITSSEPVGNEPVFAEPEADVPEAYDSPRPMRIQRASTETAEESIASAAAFEEAAKEEAAPVSDNEPKKAKKKPKKKRSKLSTAVFSIILTLAIGVFLFSGIKLFSIWLQYKTAKDAYKDVDSLFTDGTGEWEWDFSALFAQNPEAKGFIYCKDVVSYPIVQAEDNDKYLYTMFNGEYNPAGSLFIDYRIKDGLEARNCVIYGHNMNDGSMFGKLEKYQDREFYDRHKEYDVYTPDHHYKYKVLSTFLTPVDGFVYTYDFANDDEFVKFANQTISSSAYSTEHEPITADSKLITLSTCTWDSNEAYRYVVVLIRDRVIK